MNRYYVETGPDLYKSGFQRMVGGSTWAWRGNTPRFLPSDFEKKTRYGVARRGRRREGTDENDRPLRTGRSSLH
ncbi:hypothetical protein ACIRP7_36640 [Streptomyces sp. NPDC102270]|uniref:hypothetical protein n=1 Tax=Streptomyces sp. NPDC102270 TaxID=3366150 RepID=UPI00381CF23A